ncbi:hypothetical protein ACQP25_05325 [Microtetraspora malaysiensis]|uniref:hypothetical protein n=1 Tax=Microtetraspora malaysiensis TaxID=161358 RepID=UPI003D9092DB
MRLGTLGGARAWHDDGGEVPVRLDATASMTRLPRPRRRPGPDPLTARTTP